MEDSNIYASHVSYGSTYSKGFISKNDQLSNNFPSVTGIKNVKDLDENKARAFYEVYTYNSISSNYHLAHSLPVEMTKPVLSSQSPSEQTSIIIRTVEKKIIVEVISITKPSIRIDVSKAHGDVISESWFGGSSWSYDERYFVYVSKSNDDNRQSYFGYDSTTKPVDSKDSESKVAPSKYEYVEDWGERFDGLSSLRFVIVDIHAGKVTILPDFHSGTSTCGQPQFRPGNRSKYELVYTAWSNLPRKLGMVYCYQRKCALQYIDITRYLMTEDIATVSRRCLTSTYTCSRSPRFDDDGNMLVFISRKDQMQTHNGCMQLSIIRHINDVVDESSAVDVLVDLVDNPDMNNFPGLYLDQLPTRCFSKDHMKLYLCSVWGGRDALLSISTSTGDITEITSKQLRGDNNSDYSSISLLDVQGDHLMLTISDPVHPQQLVVMNVVSNHICTLPRSFASMPVSMKAISNTSIDEYQASTSYKVFQHVADGIVFESILLTPSNISQPALPIILVPHGGPHSCISCAYYASYAYLVSRLQAAVLFVNYRGSTGYGERSIKSLPGNIGRYDVDDCITSLNHALTLTYHDMGITSSSNDGVSQLMFDRSKVAVIGGSHGGFLAAHLIGQYPDLFKAACLRNPVTHIPEFVGVSDIPDWCWVEAGTSYDFSRFDLPPESVLEMMKRVSPSQYVDQVKTPTLICLGAKDRRVHPSQGVVYYHLLKTRGVECNMMIYPEDNHAIDRPSTEAEHWIAISSWLAKYL